MSDWGDSSTIDSQRGVGAAQVWAADSKDVTSPRPRCGHIVTGHQAMGQGITFSD